MKTKSLPFNVSILKVDAEATKYMRPVTSSDMMKTSGQRLGATDSFNTNQLSWSGDNRVSSNFTDNGLFSIPIFGRIGEASRDTKFSYIDIKVSIFHPLIFKSFKKLKTLYGDILSGKAYAIWNNDEKDFIISNQLEGDTGFSFFYKHWKDIVFKQTGSKLREARINLIEKYKDSAATSRILVLPAGLRDLTMGSSGNLESDPINENYKRLINIARTISGTGSALESSTLDYSRFQLQLAFNNIYSTNDPKNPGIKERLSSKSGFIQAKWAKRTVFNATRNVITSMDTSKRLLGDVHGPKATDTIIGLYQLIRGILPVTINLLRNSYLSDIFAIGSTDNAAYLVNAKTLKKELVRVPYLIKDAWTTFDGLNKVINSYFDVNNRHKHIIIEDHYLALIYKGPDKTFRIFSDIDDLPEHLDRKYVEPLSLIELLYLSGYKEWLRYRVVVARYPVATIDSAYPSTIYVKTTAVAEQRMELNNEWEPMGKDYIAPEFPTKKPLSFIDSQQVSSIKIKGLGADFDGDTASALFIYSEEAIEEINKHLASREAHVDSNNKVRSKLNLEVLALVLRNLTGDYADI